MTGGHREVKLPVQLTDDVVTVIAEPLREAARSPQVSRLTLDAADTVDLSARGLGLLVAVSRIARSRGAEVVIIDPPAGLHPLFEAAKLDYRPRLQAAD